MKPFDFSNIDSSWTLFLDRDGVINRRIVGDYVKHIDEFEFLPGVLDALEVFGRVFGTIVVVTNQQGIGKGVMSERDLLVIHQHMLSEIFMNGGRVDEVFHCPELANADAPCRKPNTGMAIEARKHFPNIEYAKSIMIGDSPSDMEFGSRMGMQCFFIGENPDFESYPSLFNFSERISSK